MPHGPTVCPPSAQCYRTDIVPLGGGHRLVASVSVICPPIATPPVQMQPLTFWLALRWVAPKAAEASLAQLQLQPAERLRQTLARQYAMPGKDGVSGLSSACSSVAFQSAGALLRRPFSSLFYCRCSSLCPSLSLRIQLYAILFVRPFITLAGSPPYITISNLLDVPFFALLYPCSIPSFHLFLHMPFRSVGCVLPSSLVPSQPLWHAYYCTCALPGK